MPETETRHVLLHLRSCVSLATSQTAPFPSEDWQGGRLRRHTRCCGSSTNRRNRPLQHGRAHPARQRSGLSERVMSHDTGTDADDENPSPLSSADVIP